MWRPCRAVGDRREPGNNPPREDFADRWPSGNMRAEYTPGQYHIYLKDPTWYSKVEPQRAHKEHMAGGRKIAGPYIWHVKDEEPIKTKREVQRHWRTPYFLQSSLANRMEALGTSLGPAIGGSMGVALRTGGGHARFWPEAASQSTKVGYG